MAEESLSVQCCPDPSFEVLIDFQDRILDSVYHFLERRGRIPTLRNGTPRMDPGAWTRIRDQWMAEPLPAPDLLLHYHGSPPPDRGPFVAWPRQSPEDEKV